MASDDRNHFSGSLPVDSPLFPLFPAEMLGRSVLTNGELLNAVYRVRNQLAVFLDSDIGLAIF